MVRGSTWLLLGLGGLFGLACSGLPFMGPTIPLPTEFGPEEIAVAESLGASLTDGVFPASEIEACDRNGSSFLWLAARSSSPEVVAASLLALAACPTLEQPNGMSGVVGGRLGDNAPAVRLGALRAAASIVGTVPAHDPMLARLVALATIADPAVRYETLVVLDDRDWPQEPLVAAAFLAAMHDTESPWLVTEALRRVRPLAAELPDPGPFRSIAFALTMDLDPGIRGRAALLLAGVDPANVDVRERLLSMLDDPHGFARSAAAEALADCGHMPAVHKILFRIQDPAKNTWDMLPFTRLDGTPEVPHHVGSELERVGEAYLQAVERLTAPMGDDGFVCREIDLEYIDLDIIAATRDAKRWYQASGDLIPEE